MRSWALWNRCSLRCSGPCGTFGCIGVVLREYTLEVYDLAGHKVGEEPVRVSDQPGRTVLHRLARRHVISTGSALGALADGRRVSSVFLAPDALPNGTIGTSGSSLDRGAWFTTVAMLPAQVRGLIGPDAFRRQIDVTVPWIARILMRFVAPADVRTHTFGRATVTEMAYGDGRYFYLEGRGRWRFYGAGNVSKEAIDEALQRGVESPEDLFWALGAIKLG
jgi:hypothetical protein